MGRATGTDTRMSTWMRGATAGLLGGLVFGLMMWLMMRPVLTDAIPALWTLDGALAGWFVHLVNSAIFGVLFAALVTRTGLAKYADSTMKIVGLGLAFGLALWLVAAAIVMPIWLDAVGFTGAPSVPNFDAMSLVGHLVYGLVLGAVYPHLK